MVRYFDSNWFFLYIYDALSLYTLSRCPEGNYIHWDYDNKLIEDKKETKLSFILL